MNTQHTVVIQAHSLLLLSPYGNRAVSRYPADAETRPSDVWHGIRVESDPLPLRESVATLLAGLTINRVRFLRRCNVGLAQVGYGDVDAPVPDAGPADTQPSTRVGNPQFASLQRKLFSARAALSRAKATVRTRGHAIPIDVLEARVQACQDALRAYSAQVHDDSKRNPVQKLTGTDGLYIACRCRSLRGTRGVMPTCDADSTGPYVTFWDANR